MVQLRKQQCILLPYFVLAIYPGLPLMHCEQSGHLSFCFSSSSAAAIIINIDYRQLSESGRVRASSRSPFAVCLVCGPHPVPPTCRRPRWQEGACGCRCGCGGANRLLSLSCSSRSPIAIFSTRIRSLTLTLSRSRLPLSVLSVVVAFHYICCCWLAIDFMLCRCNQFFFCCLLLVCTFSSHFLFTPSPCCCFCY